MDKSRIIANLRDIARKYRVMASVARELAPQYNDIADDLDAAAKLIQGGDAG